MSALVILLHGVGSRGADLAGLGDLWHAQLPDATFVSPDAPFAFDQGGNGRQWFSVRGVTTANRPQRVADARPNFDQTVQAIVDAHGFADRLDQVALVGFSQGSIMALDAVAYGRWPVGAIVAFSGRLAATGPLTPAMGTKVLLIHGDSDPVIPAQDSIQAEAALRNGGVEAHVKTLRGIGHTISGEGAALAAEFLARTIGGTRK